METKTKSSFSELINNSDIPVLVDFHAEWCGPCHAMAPVINELAAEVKNRVKIIKVDIDKNPAVSTVYKIMGVPTFILFHKGQIKWRHSGMISKVELMRAIGS